jgi:phosphoribosylglycinamide formyltransferase-1
MAIFNPVVTLIIYKDGKILLQKKVPVLEGDTPETLYARIAPEEHKAMVEGLILLCKELEK